jgi:hypothetical protein
MTNASPSDTAYRRLHRSAWSIGDTSFSRPPGVAWRVYGRNGENVIPAEARTRDEAWQAALEQAWAVGMLVD